MPRLAFCQLRCYRGGRCSWHSRPRLCCRKCDNERWGGAGLHDCRVYMTGASALRVHSVETRHAPSHVLAFLFAHTTTVVKLPWYLESTDLQQNTADINSRNRSGSPLSTCYSENIE